MSQSSTFKGLADLTSEQQAVVSSWGQGQAVLAGAGSGKTTTLVIKCAELVKRNPEGRFAAVSFTEKSASELREKLSERGLLDEDQGRHWVATIHGLCSAVLREFPRFAGLDGEESVLTEAEAEVLWKQALHSLWFGELQEEVLRALEILLLRESRSGLITLLSRVKALQGFGVLDRLGDDPDSRALHRVASYTLDRYERLKRRRGALDFDDLEKAADRVLAHESARQAFQRRFDLVMVDEFQDTNPVQARILWNFVRPDLSNLCVVGDPKQSIYRFRDADVTVFQEYCSRLPVQQSLTWNFRSRPAVIDFVNQVCEPLFQASEMPYENLIPKREPGNETSGVVRVNVNEPSELARWIRAEQTRGVPLGDMAIILRKIRGNEKWLGPLVAARIPLAIGSGGFFWEDPRVHECVAALAWWDNPANTLSAATFLRAPWMGIPDETLDRWVAEDPTFHRPFFASDHPVARVLAPFLRSILSPGEFLLKLIENEAGEVELGISLLSLWHRAEELSLAGLDFHQVVREFRDSIEKGRRESDIPPPENSGQVRVMTVHGSKGLEFPVVIMADFGKPWRGRGTPILLWDREKGAYLGRRTEDGKRDSDDPIEGAFRADEKFKELCESKRLFYVALTRARERLVLVFPTIEIKETKKKTEVNPLLIDHWRGWIEKLATDLAQARVVEASSTKGEASGIPSVDSSGTSSDPVVSHSRLLRRPRHSVTEWTVLARCPRAYDWTYLRPHDPQAQSAFAQSTAVLPPSDDPDRQELDARELGTAVHSILERAEFLSCEEWFGELQALEKRVGPGRMGADAIHDWLKRSPWMQSGMGKGTKQNEGFRSWRELSFEVPIRVSERREPAVLIGSIDRLVKHPTESRPAGESFEYALLDFKVTGRVKDPQVLRENYSLQLALYTWALGVLEPETRGRTRAILLNLHPEGVQEVEVALPSWVNALETGHTFVRRLAEQADELLNAGLNTQGAVPRPGLYCERCRFQADCVKTP